MTPSYTVIGQGKVNNNKATNLEFFLKKTHGMEWEPKSTVFVAYLNAKQVQ